MKKFNWKSLLPHVAAVVIFLIIALVYNKPALEGKVLDQSDITQWKGMAAQSFKYKETHGHFPLWTNSAFSGMPAYQIAMDSSNPLSPGYLHNLFTLFLPKPINFFFLMCISFYFLTQVLRIDFRLGILAGIAYAYASFTPQIVAAGHDTQALAMGYVPALLAAVLLVFQKKYWVGGALTAIFVSSLIGQNHPQVAYYFILVAISAGVAYLVSWIRNKEYKHILVSLTVLVAAGIAGAAVNLVSLATTLDFSKATMRNGTLNLDTTGKETRTSSGLPIDYAFGWSFGKSEVLTVLVPNIYGGSQGELGADSHLAKTAVEKGVPDDQAESLAKGYSAYSYWGALPFTSGPVYLGAVMCFLFIFGLIYLKGFDKWWILAICILAVMMSWGSNFMGFNEFLFNHLPLYNKFRVPTMTVVILQLLFPLLGVLALQQFLFKETDKAYAWKKLKVTGFVMAGIFLIIGFLYTSFDYKSANDTKQVIPQFTQMVQGNQDVANSLYKALKDDRQAQFGADIVRSLVFAGLAFALLFLAVKNKIKPVYAVVGLVLLGAADTISESRRYFSDERFADQETISAEAEQPSPIDLQIMQDSSFYRVLNLTRDYSQEAYTSYHHNSIGGYSPAKLSIVEDLLTYQLRGGNQLNVQVLNMLNTKYVIVPGAKGQPTVQQNPGALGNCWFVKSLQFVKGPAEAMKVLNNFNPKDTAVVEEAFKSTIPFTPVYDSTASIKLIKNDNDLISYTSSAKTNQLAVFSEIFYDRGWKAYVDDKELPIIKVDYALRALALPAGNHNIRFEFKPASYYNSSAIANIASVLIWLSVIAAIVVTYKKKPENNTKAI